MSATKRVESSGLLKSHSLAEVIRQYNSSTYERGEMDSSPIRVEQTSYGSGPVEVRISRRKGLTGEDVRYILDTAEGLNGVVHFEQTGDIVVRF